MLLVLLRTIVSVASDSTGASKIDAIPGVVRQACTYEKNAESVTSAHTSNAAGCIDEDMGAVAKAMMVAASHDESATITPWTWSVVRIQIEWRYYSQSE